MASLGQLSEGTACRLLARLYASGATGHSRGSSPVALKRFMGVGFAEWGSEFLWLAKRPKPGAGCRCLMFMKLFCFWRMRILQAHLSRVSTCSQAHLAHNVFIKPRVQALLACEMSPTVGFSPAHHHDSRFLSIDSAP